MRAQNEGIFMMYPEKKEFPKSKQNSWRYCKKPAQLQLTGANWLFDNISMNLASIS